MNRLASENPSTLEGWNWIGCGETECIASENTSRLEVWDRINRGASIGPTSENPSTLEGWNWIGCGATEGLTSENTSRLEEVGTNFILHDASDYIIDETTFTNCVALL
ncbi:hypothetical protein J6590_044002 [Homalodisca vitripennis]|nr:hypothetical protein J6590_044002 [Homalodisca vitripennis]